MKTVISIFIDDDDDDDSCDKCGDDKGGNDQDFSDGVSDKDVGDLCTDGGDNHRNFCNYGNNGDFCKNTDKDGEDGSDDDHQDVDDADDSDDEELSAERW